MICIIKDEKNIMTYEEAKVFNMDMLEKFVLGFQGDIKSVHNDDKNMVKHTFSYGSWRFLQQS